MLNKLSITTDDVYEEMAATFQVIEIDRLNKILKRHKVPAKARRKICEDYFFDSGVFLDSGWLKADGRKVSPRLCFAERVTKKTAPAGSAKLYAPSELFSFHEYVHGDLDEYFEDSAESVGDIEHGDS